HIEVRKGKFGVFVDPTYIQLSVRENVPLGNGIEVDEVVFKNFLLEVGGFYRMGTWPIGSPYNNFVQRVKPSLTLDVLAGGRYTYLDLEIDLDGTPRGCDRKLMVIRTGLIFSLADGLSWT
ncbi:MAG: hypothetical protein L0Y68_06090, partial [Candidatus Dadabacteria bacterium]|nr:hypothetical protein [Candidatus Dadabacteria bacterium]